MTARVTTPRRRHRRRRAVLVTLGVLVGVPLLLVTGLVVWDGGANLDPHRELLPGVTLDLRTAQTARGPVEYDLYGSGGPVVLSVHAGLGGADQGRLFASWLQNDGYRILSPSRPGYLGTPLTGGQTLVEQADLLVALLDALHIDRVGVFTASAGSPVAYTLAARYPDRVWGLVSVSGVSLPDPDARASSRVQTLVNNAFSQKVATLTATVSLESVVTSTLDETSTFTDAQKKARTDYVMRTESARRFFAALFDATLPYERRMPGTDNDLVQTRTMAVPYERINAPTLVLHGTRDGDVPFANGENAASRIPGARHLWLADEDHLAFWLSPRSTEFQQAVRVFLRQHAP